MIGGELPTDDGHGVRSWASAAPAAPVIDQPSTAAPAPTTQPAPLRPIQPVPAQPSAPPTTESSPPAAHATPAPTAGEGPAARDLLAGSRTVVATAAAEETIAEGTARALTAHLEAALSNIGGPVQSACGSLGALVHLLSAQYDKDVPAALADELIGAARTALEDLSCD